MQRAQVVAVCTYQMFNKSQLNHKETCAAASKPENLTGDETVGCLTGTKKETFFEIVFAVFNKSKTKRAPHSLFQNEDNNKQNVGHYEAEGNKTLLNNNNAVAVKLPSYGGCPRAFTDSLV